MNVVDMVSKIFRTAASSFFIFDGMLVLLGVVVEMLVKTGT